VDYPAPVARLIDELRRLPGIGPKSAQRIAFHLLRGSKEDASRLSAAVGELLDGIRACSVCNAVTDRDVCATCTDPTRNDRIVCVVEEPHEVHAIEKTGDFRGRYHVLHGALSPLQGVGPDELRIQGLLDRVRRGGIEEVILYFNFGGLNHQETLKSMERFARDVMPHFADRAAVGTS